MSQFSDEQLKKLCDVIIACTLSICYSQPSLKADQAMQMVPDNPFDPVVKTQPFGPIVPASEHPAGKVEPPKKNRMKKRVETQPEGGGI